MHLGQPSFSNFQAMLAMPKSDLKLLIDSANLDIIHPVLILKAKNLYTNLDFVDRGRDSRRLFK